MKKIEYELKPIHDRAKSFYGKAFVIVEDFNGVEIKALKSYDTIVCEIYGGDFRRLWNGYSATTMRHVNEFAAQNGINDGGKAWWDSLEVCL